MGSAGVAGKLLLDQFGLGFQDVVQAQAWPPHVTVY
jgi:hypothetical protein